MYNSVFNFADKAIAEAAARQGINLDAACFVGTPVKLKTGQAVSVRTGEEEKAVRKDMLKQLAEKFPVTSRANPVQVTELSCYSELYFPKNAFAAVSRCQSCIGALVLGV